MRNIGLSLTAALLTAGAAVAQLPRPNQGPSPGFFVRPDTLPVEVMVERIMAFDKNKDGKVTKEELPERMHHLIELGDTNKDGALDREEIRNLVAARADTPGGPGAPGFGVGGFRTGFRPGPGPGFLGLPPGAIEGVVDDLKLSGKKKDQALAAVKAHQESVRKLMDEARTQLIQKMKAILSEEELRDFQAALDRPRGGADSIIFGREGPRPAGLQRRVDVPRKKSDDSSR
jgi:hypothetical protein